MKTLLLSTAAFCFAAVAALADPSGHYSVTGKTPQGKEYSADLEIAKVGEVYELTYTYGDGSEQEGSAIGDNEFLAYSYGDDDVIGVGLMSIEGENWTGVWTNVGASAMGLETWTRK